MGKLSIGLDFGTLSVRALVVDCVSGEEVAEATYAYPHKVITDNLPVGFALQHPDDYLMGAKHVLIEATNNVVKSDIIGIGIDFTACTMLPVDEMGLPLMKRPEFEGNPHAMVKLWKHHGAHFEAQEITRIAREDKEDFLTYYGGTISSEWMLPKIWETLRQAPAIYHDAHKFMDAGDWLVHNLTGQWTRSACFAGYKGLWNKESGLPSKNFLRKLDPKLENANEKVIEKIMAPGELAGQLNIDWALETGIPVGTAVSVATIDAHSGVPGMGVYQDGSACMIMGTSTCHMFLSKELKKFEGAAGVAWNGIVEGLYGYESGQAAVGDLFAYQASFSKDTLDELTQAAAKLLPGQSGLIALDWHNGSRSPIMDTRLSSVIVGQTLETKPYEVYRAMVEATAFGTRSIFETYEDNGIAVREVYACGGLTRLPFIMQIYADILGVPVHVAESGQAVALGAAIFGALAAGKFVTLEEAVNCMTKKCQMTYLPEVANREVYKDLYGQYKQLQNYFGRSNKQFMHDLKQIQNKQLHIAGEKHE
ncbi:MAG TPA: ribulokinase [Bacteriovoracaceae bacterium]|nr:ribulokinase [Bacteriovoracaceae bacterium]